MPASFPTGFYQGHSKFHDLRPEGPAPAATVPAGLYVAVDSDEAADAYFAFLGEAYPAPDAESPINPLAN